MADPRGSWGASSPPPSPSSDYFSFYKSKVYLQKLVLNEYEICLKMLEMAILETQIFKIFWGGGMPPDPPRKLAPLALVGAPPPPPPFENLESAPVPISVFNTLVAPHLIYAHTGSLKLYVTMLIGYAENDVYLHLSLSQCLKLSMLKRLFFKNAVVKIAITIQM